MPAEGGFLDYRLEGADGEAAAAGRERLAEDRGQPLPLFMADASPGTYRIDLTLLACDEAGCDQPATAGEWTCGPVEVTGRAQTRVVLRLADSCVVEGTDAS